MKIILELPSASLRICGTFPERAGRKIGGLHQADPAFGTEAERSTGLSRKSGRRADTKNPRQA
ncbi:hypothetical protein [Lachnoclostridium sp. An118]|uniref:hypothetical protein n=1 Tax=Lachnoclostridium sp. An118 TaxID=1965547 RepID=UPI0019D1D672|nr:hypothetical protein [Lachnoclostridium sp. An118]